MQQSVEASVRSIRVPGERAQNGAMGNVSNRPQLENHFRINVFDGQFLLNKRSGSLDKYIGEDCSSWLPIPVSDLRTIRNMA